MDPALRSAITNNIITTIFHYRAADNIQDTSSCKMAAKSAAELGKCQEIPECVEEKRM